MAPMAPLPLLLALLLALNARADTPPAPEPLPVEGWQDSVLLLITGAAWCSAVLVDERGTVATAYHCVASGRRPQLRTRDGERHLGRVVATAPRDDLAILEVPGLAGRPHLDIREQRARQGEEVWALGHPYAPQADSSPLLEGTLVWSASRGVVSAVGSRLVQVDAALNPGNSGGPLVDEQGRVIGIASRRLGGDNIAFMAPATGLLQLLEEPRRPPIGGTWGVGLGVLQGTGLEDASSIGPLMLLGLRDTVVLRAGLHLPVNHRWMALQRGSARWVSAELAGSMRLRAGRGRYSTTFDLGGTCLLGEGLTGSIQDDAVQLWASAPQLWPGGTLAVGFAGSELRFLVVRGPDGWLPLLGVDLGYPGVLGVF